MINYRKASVKYELYRTLKALNYLFKNNNMSPAPMMQWCIVRYTCSCAVYRLLFYDDKQIT